MPAMLPAAAATTALGTGAAIGTGAALGTGLAAGSALAGGAGLAGIMGGMGALGGAGTAGSVLGGAMAPAAMSAIAPAAASQAAGTLVPGLAGTVGGSVAPGAFGANLASAGLPAAGFNPATAQAAGADFLAKAQASGMPIAKPFGAESMLANASSTNITPQSLVNAQGNIGGTVSTPWSGIQPYQHGNFPVGTPLHAGNITTAPTSVASPSTFSDAGFRGLQPNALNTPSLSNPAGAPVNPTDIVGRSIRPDQNWMQNLTNIGSFQDVKDYAELHPYATSAMAGLGAMGITKALNQKGVEKPEDNAMIRPYTYTRTQRPEAYATSPGMDSSERMYFSDQYTPLEPYKAAEGGIASAYALGGSVEQMSDMNAIGANTGYPMASLQTPMYSNPGMQRPEATNVIAPSADAGVGAYTGEPRFAEGGEAKTEGGYKYSYDPNTMQFTQLSVPTVIPSRGVIGGGMGGMGGIPYTAPAPQPVKNSGSKISGGIAPPAMGPTQSQQSTPINIPAYQTPEQQLGLNGFYDMMNQQLAGYGGYAKGGNVGGESHLGDYSDGGRLLKGPGDGVSDSIPASIGGRQPARLADGEFVVPARIVSELGNGSTEAGARKLYAMMDRIQKGRRKTVGKGKVAVNSKADKHLPA